jgi:hypothetical protein
MVMNRVVLVGQVGVITFAATKQGKRYCRFNLRAKNNNDTDSYVSPSNVRVFCICFDERAVKYIEHNVVNGDTIEVQGRLTSYSKSFPGLQYPISQNSVNVTWAELVRLSDIEEAQHPDPEAEADLNRDQHDDIPF